MKAFKFTLQTLLGVKLALEKRYKGDLAACERRIAALSEQLRQLIYAFEAHKAEFMLIFTEQGLHPPDIEAWSVGFGSEKEGIARQRQRIKDAENEKKLIQKKLLEVMQERKVLEKLREGQLEEYKTACKAEDAALVDEFLSNRVHAGRGGL
jgi:flagellar export protein FliJ